LLGLDRLATSRGKESLMTTHRIGTARSLVLAAVALFGLGIGARHALAWANGGCVAAAYVTPGGVLSFYCANGTCPMPAGCFVTGAPSGPEGSTGEFNCVCNYVSNFNCGRKVTWVISGGVAVLTDAGCSGPCPNPQDCLPKTPYLDPNPPYGTIKECECR
jgi:hypothetical protein